MEMDHHKLEIFKALHISTKDILDVARINFAQINGYDNNHSSEEFVTALLNLKQAENNLWSIQQQGIDMVMFNNDEQTAIAEIAKQTPVILINLFGENKEVKPAFQEYLTAFIKLAFFEEGMFDWTNLVSPSLNTIHSPLITDLQHKFKISERKMEIYLKRQLIETIPNLLEDNPQLFAELYEFSETDFDKNIYETEALNSVIWQEIPDPVLADKVINMWEALPQRDKIMLARDTTGFECGILLSKYLGVPLNDTKDLGIAFTRSLAKSGLDEYKVDWPSQVIKIKPPTKSQ